jgi:hypothetical protein
MRASLCLCHCLLLPPKANILIFAVKARELLELKMIAKTFVNTALDLKRAVRSLVNTTRT